MNWKPTDENNGCVVNEISTTRLMKHFTDDKTLALISTFRTEMTESENLSLLKELKSWARDNKFGFTEFVSRWSEQDKETGKIDSSDGRSLAIYGISKDDVMKEGAKYQQSSVLFKDETGCYEICTTPFKDYDGNSFDVGDVVRKFNVSSDTPFNLEQAERIFARREGGPASMPVKGKRAFRLNEVCEVEPVHSSTFSTKSRMIPLFKSNVRNADMSTK